MVRELKNMKNNMSIVPFKKLLLRAVAIYNKESRLRSNTQRYNNDNNENNVS